METSQNRKNDGRGGLQSSNISERMQAILRLHGVDRDLVDMLPLLPAFRPRRISVEKDILVSLRAYRTRIWKAKFSEFHTKDQIASLKSSGEMDEYMDRWADHMVEMTEVWSRERYLVPGTILAMEAYMHNKESVDSYLSVDEGMVGLE